MDLIVEEIGFADSDRMRRAFLRTLGQLPQTIGLTRAKSRGAMNESGERGVVELARPQHACDAKSGLLKGRAEWPLGVGALVA